MAALLEMPHLPEKDGVTQVKIWCGRIETGLDAKWPVGGRTLLKPLLEILFSDDLGEASLECF